MVTERVTQPLTQARRLVLWIATLVSFIAFLDGSVINVALPAISRELGGGLATQQWVIDAYLITLAMSSGSMLAAARLMITAPSLAAIRVTACA